MIRTFLPIIGGALGVFIGAIPFFLFMNGMLCFEAPHLRPAEDAAVPDSLRDLYETLRESTEEGKSAAGLTEQTGGSWPEEGITAGDESGGKVGQAELIVSEEDVGVTGGEVVESKELVAAAVGSNIESLGGEGSRGGNSHERMARLVRVYEKMRPRQVALILGTMPEPEAVSILAEMKDKQAARVMAEMDAQKAARISQILMRNVESGT